MKRSRIILAGRTLAVALVLAVLGTTPSFGYTSIVSGSSGPWETFLQPRDLTGDGIADAFYDTSSNVTWLRNWKPLGRLVVRSEAVAWADSLAIGSYSDWRLPTARSLPGVRSELDAVFFDSLRNTYSPTYGPNGEFIYPLIAGPFENLTGGWWHNAIEPVDGVLVVFDVNCPCLSGEDIGNVANAVAVHSGDIGVPAPIPEPSSYALMSAALLALALARRWRRDAAAMLRIVPDPNGCIERPA